jgi:Domain of unknown function (DUF4838)/Glycosyl hydrolase family 67 N-terminus
MAPRLRDLQRILILGVSLLMLSCGSQSGGSNGEPTSSDPNTFSIPRQIVVSVTPYASVQEALNDQQNIDWIRDKIRARAITLAYAAQELHDHLALIGVDASISTTDATLEKPSFVLAVQEQSSPEIPLAGAELDYDGFRGQSYVITPRQNHLYITAGDRVGVLYGVYRLLEYVGFAWYDPFETRTPSRSISNDLIEWRQLDETPRVKLRGFWIFGSETIPDEFAVWLARNRFNVGGKAKSFLQHKLGIKGWGGGHDLLQQEFSRPGLFEQHPEWYALIDGVRQPVVESGNYYNPSFANADAANYFADRMIERLANGDLQDIDILNIWPTDDRFNNFDQSPAALALGNETDNLLQFYFVVSNRFREAYESGRLPRQVVVAGISYYLTMEPPTNQSITAELQTADYVHIFYLNERDWSDYIDANLSNRDSNRKIVSDLAAWKAVANLNYGVVEYYNYSVFAALGLSDFPFLAGNYETLIPGRGSIFAYMHPLLTNPGPRRLTNSLLARLAWQTRLNGNRIDATNDGSEQIVQEYFERRYAGHATEWREIYQLMSQSVENAKEMFGSSSLDNVLFQELIWAEPPYTRSQAAAFTSQYRLGGVQDLPAAFSGATTVRESFRGLDESIQLQEIAAAEWQAVLAGALEADIRRRMESDVAWFMATASRYRLMAATCDYVVARENQLDLNEPRARMAREIAFLQSTSVTQDTISPVDQRSFLDHHRALAGIP